MSRLGERFVLERQIGAGGMARVFLAKDVILERFVAVKILKPIHDDTDVGARFRREGRTAARLSHPNIVPVYDAGEGEFEGHEVSYIVMEYVPGGDLKDLIDEKGPLPNAELARLGAEVSTGLAHAHSRSIIHRDIKPHNILIDSYGRPKLTDFGIARALDATETTQTGAYLGTALYSSPEQLQGEKVTPKSDVYSLGVTLYQAAVGRVPFAGTPIEVANQHISRMPTGPTVLGARLSDEVETLILDCIDKDPDRRPSVEEVHKRLLEAAQPTRTTHAQGSSPIFWAPERTERTHAFPSEVPPPEPAPEPPAEPSSKPATEPFSEPPPEPAPELSPKPAPEPPSEPAPETSQGSPPEPPAEPSSGPAPETSQESPPEPSPPAEPSTTKRIGAAAAEAPTAGPVLGVAWGEDGQNRRRRGPILFAAVVLLLVVLGVAVTYAVLGSGGTDLIAQSSPEESQQASPSGDTGQDTTSAGSTESTSAQESSTGGQGGSNARAAAAQTVEDFYTSAAAHDYDRAASLLTANQLQNYFPSRAYFEGQFGTLRQIYFVEGPDAQVSDGTATVTGVTIAEHTNRTERNRGTWTLVNDNGQWKISNWAVGNISIQYK